MNNQSVRSDLDVFKGSSIGQHICQSNCREAGGQALPTLGSPARALFLSSDLAIANDRNLLSVMDTDSIILQISNGLAQHVDDLMKIWIYAG